jgi:MSHA biogenesis protein MshO
MAIVLSLLRKNNSQKLNKVFGFSLIEMIVVMVVLGVLATGISTFINFGTQIYTDATARDQLVSSARFAIERLNREIRNAVPNSVCLTNTLNSECADDDEASQCLKFTPIIEATTYLDIPVIPEPASKKIELIKFTQLFDADWNVIVYPLKPGDIYDPNGKIFPVLKPINIDDDRDDWEIELNDAIHFSNDSPTQRIYFAKNAVSYCLISGELFRGEVLMAEGITNSTPFTIENASLQRNSIVQVVLTFTKNNEEITFNNEIQVPNVP